METQENSGENSEIAEEVRVMTTEEKLENALIRIQEIENRLQSSNVFSDKFWKRATAIYGNTLIVSTTLSVILFFLLFVFAMIVELNKR